MEFETTYALVRQVCEPYGVKAGQEVCFGIHRGLHPRWAGWEVVDGLKAEAPAGSAAFGALLAEDVFLDLRLREHYRQACAVLGLELFPSPWDRLVLETALEFGPALALRLLALALGEVTAAAHALQGEGSTLAAALERLEQQDRQLVYKEYLLQRIFFYPARGTSGGGEGGGLAAWVGACASLSRALEPAGEVVRLRAADSRPAD